MIRLLIVFMFCLVCYGCLKQQPSLPPYTGNDDPLIAVNEDIAGILSRLPAAGTPVLLDTDMVLAVQVIADDRSGNLYHQLVVADNSGGITLRIHSGQLYRTYPVGRKIYVRVKGLFLSDEYGLPCLGAIPVKGADGLLQVSDIPERDMKQYLIPANFPPLPVPPVKHMDDLLPLNARLLNSLIRIADVELVNPAYDRHYSEPEQPSGIALRDCNGHQMIMRISNYASFRKAITPSGHGSITAVYSVYKGVPQLLIRDTGDLDMHGTRCDGAVYGLPAMVSIDSIRRLYAGRDTLLRNYQVHGVVISDAAGRNHGAGGNVIIQDGNAGVVIYFGSGAAGLPVLGDSVIIDLSGSILTSYNHALEIKNIRSSAVQLLARHRLVVPATVTIASLKKDFALYESILVRIDHARIADGGVYSGSKTLDDGTGTIVLFTTSMAAFAGRPVPAITKTVQGIPALYDTVKELKIRNPDIDVY